MSDKDINLGFLCRDDNDFVIDRSIISAVVNESEVMMMIFDMEGRIERVNRYARIKLGYTEDELIGKHVMEFTRKGFESSVDEDVLHQLTNGKPIKKYENTLITKDGRFLRIQWNNSLLHSSSGILSGILSIGIDVTERRSMEQKLFKLAYFDSLTGLPNRACLQKDFEFIMSGAANDEELALILMDMDDFKHVNEMLGHGYGDKLLVYISNILSYQVKEPDRIYRVSGDEFVLIYRDLKGKEDLEERIASLRKYLSRRWHLEGENFYVSLSMGISLFDKSEDDLTSLMQNANIAMEKAKEKGKDRFEFYDSSFKDKVIDNIVLGNQLRRAIDANEFVLYYQTKVDLKHKGRVTGVETLIRWNHPEKGLIPPGMFIPFAENGSLINDITIWVMHQACIQKKLWNKKDYNIKIAVNFSGKDFLNPHFVETILSILKEYDLDPSGFDIEITESALMLDPEKAQSVIRSLKNAGFSLGLDDFGQGFSSLNYLRSYHVDFLKIDREFISSINTNRTGEHILNSIINLAHKLEIVTIAEGVENKGQAEYLIKEGCDFAQGYFFSRPSPAEDIEVFFV